MAQVYFFERLNLFLVAPIDALADGLRDVGHYLLVVVLLMLLLLLLSLVGDLCRLRLVNTCVLLLLLLLLMV